jgi:hypothetical protein
MKEFLTWKERTKIMDEAGCVCEKRITEGTLSQMNHVVVVDFLETEGQRTF